MEIQSTPPHGHLALITALEPFLVVTMPGVGESFKDVIVKMSHGTKFKLVNWMYTEDINRKYEDLTTGIDKQENGWNIHLVSYDMLKSRAKPSSSGQLSYCSCIFGMVDESHRYKMKNSVGWQIVMNVKIGFKLQVTATPGFHSLYDWCFQTMWLFLDVSEDPKVNNEMEKHSAKAWYSAVKSWCMQSGLKTKELNRLPSTRCYRLQSHGRIGGGRN